ncbi:MAG: SGNH/GDSL hydrolase family protein [Verrucomicrobiota bacterium]
MIRPFALLTIVALALSPSLPAAEETAKKAKKQRKANPAMIPVEDDPALPRVLLIGDSISIGYTVAVRNEMEGSANVHRPLANCGPTHTALGKIDDWLATGGAGKKWDVIHFNWGLHDLKYMGTNGENLADPKAEDSHQQVPPEEYRKNLTQLVETLKATGARLIWRNTTPVPEGAKGRVVGDSAKYNAIAAEIMETHEVEVQDLFSFIVEETAKDPGFSMTANVHFSPTSSAAMAEKIAERLTAALSD